MSDADAANSQMLSTASDFVNPVKRAFVEGFWEAKGEVLSLSVISENVSYIAKLKQPFRRYAGLVSRLERTAVTSQCTSMQGR